MKQIIDNLSAFRIANRQKNVISCPNDECLSFNDYKIVQLGTGQNVNSQGWNLNYLYNSSAITNDFTTISDTQPLNIDVDVSDYNNVSHYGSANDALTVAVNGVLEKFPFGLWGYLGAAQDDMIIIPINGLDNPGGVSFDSISNPSNIPLVQTSTTRTSLTDYLIASGSNVEPSVIKLNYIIDTDLVIVTDGLFGNKFYDGCPVYIFPNSGSVFNFEVNLTDLEYELYRSDRKTNKWPRVDDNINIQYRGSQFNQFLTIERVKAVSADTSSSNVLKQLYVPKAYLQYDTQNFDFANLIEIYGQQYDDILNYIDQMSYAHTVGYENHDHIPKDIIDYLARQWSFSLFNDVNNQTYDKYLFPKFDNYMTGSTSMLSAKDLNYEKWRRILINIPQIYKRKGSRSVFDFVFSLYNVPSSLASLNEYVEIPNHNSWRLHKDNFKSYYVVSGSTSIIGSGSTSGLSVDSAINYKNSRIVELMLSVPNAIEYDMWQWGRINSSDIMNQKSSNYFVVTSNTADIDAWYNIIENAAIPSVNRMTTVEYTKLSSVYVDYLDDSINKLSFSKLQPYVDFIEDSYIWMFNQFIPVSVYMRGLGREYRNLRLNHQKYVWQSFCAVTQWTTPENIFTGESLNIKQQLRVNHDISNYLNISSNSCINTNYSFVDYVNNYANFLAQSSIVVERPDSVNCFVENTYYSGTSYAPRDTSVFLDVNSFATLELLSGKTGTTQFYEYNDNMISTSFDNKLLLGFTGNNFVSIGSMSGVVIRFELFKKLDDEQTKSKSKKYNIRKVAYENHFLNCGRYYIDDVADLRSDDYFMVGDLSHKIINMDKLRKFVDVKPMLNVGIHKSDYPVIRSANYFDWNNPIQTLIYSNISGITNSTSIGVDFSVYSGYVKFGGKDEIYNKEILVDKNEYCVRYRAEQQYSGTNYNTTISYLDNAVQMACQEYVKTEFYGDTYYGNYFMFLIEPKQPNLVEYPEHNISDVNMSASSNTVLFKWNGTDDADKIELQFMPSGGGDSPTISNRDIIDQMFISGNTNIFTMNYNVPNKSKGDASFYHTIQITVDPSTWYWWRIKNMRGKTNIFGRESLAYVATTSYCFKSGPGSRGVEQGQINPLPRSPRSDKSIFESI